MEESAGEGGVRKRARERERKRKEAWASRENEDGEKSGISSTPITISFYERRRVEAADIVAISVIASFVV